MRQINLMPGSLQEAHKKKKIVNSLLFTLGPTFLGIIVIHFLMVLTAVNLENKDKHPAVSIDAAEFVDLREEIQKKSEEAQKYFGAFGPVIQTHVDNYFTENILRVLGDISQHKVWFTRFDLNNDKKLCEIDGRSLNTRLVSEFMLAVKKEPYFDDVRLISMEKAQDEKVDFKIVCALK